MKKYRIMLDVITAVGSQEYWVEAKSPEDALKRFNDSEGELIYDEVQITQLSKPCLECISEVEDDEDAVRE